MKSFVNGQLIDTNTATVPLLDAGLQHAVGLFETMQAFNSRVFQLNAHIDRLSNSIKRLGLASTFKRDPLVDAIELVISENNIKDARIRLTVTGGDLSLLAANPDQPKQHQPGIYIVPSLPTVYPESYFTNGITVVIADPRVNPFEPTAGHKTLNYWTRLQCLAAAANVGAGEALSFSVTNHVCGGMVSNIFIVKDGHLFTPYAQGEEDESALPSPVLPGITRKVVCELAAQRNIPVHKQLLDINAILEADECFLTNSSWQILPVTNIEKQPVGDAKTGPITTQLIQAIYQTIGEECHCTPNTPI